MPQCKNDKTKSYNGDEPSPKGLGYCAHAEKVGFTHKGLDNNMWEVKKVSNDSKRWIKKSNESNEKKFKGYKKYFIHQNGGRPYLVYIKKLDVYIYGILNKDKLQFDDYSIKDIDNLWMYTKLIKHVKPEKIFIGNSPKIEMTISSGGHGKSFDGNSILLMLKKNKYMMIEGYTRITKFSTENDEIIKYYSFIGNNDVAYPMAIGKKYYYFFTYPEGYLDKKEFSKIKNTKDLQIILDEARVYDPFLISLKDQKNKSKKISLEEFKNIKQKPLKDISIKEMKELAKLFTVNTSGSKKELADRIKKLRRIKVHS